MTIKDMALYITFTDDDGDEVDAVLQYDVPTEDWYVETPRHYRVAEIMDSTPYTDAVRKAIKALCAVGMIAR